MKYILSLIFLLFAAQASAATYYVTQSGDGSGDGSTLGNAASIATHNAGTGVFADLSGDTVSMSGNITTTLQARTGATYGGTATFTTYSANSTSINISGVSNVTVQDTTVDWDHTTAMGSTLINLYGIRVINSSNISIDHNTITETPNAILIYTDSDTVSITRNTFQRNTETGIFMTATWDHPITNVTIGGSAVNANTFIENTYKTLWGSNTVGYDIRADQSTSHLVVSHNHHYSNTANYMMSALLLHGTKNVLVEHNKMHANRAFNARPMISIKGADTATTTDAYKAPYNIIIRFNELWDLDVALNPYTAPAQDGISVSGNWHDIYIYGNWIRDADMGIDFNPGNWSSPATDTDGVHVYNGFVWANIIQDSVTGLSITEYSATDRFQKIYYLNNTVHNAGAFLLAASGNRLENVYVKNNIIHTSPNGSYTFRAPVPTSYTVETDYNMHWPSSHANVYWQNSASCTPCAYNSANVPTGQGDNDLSADPLWMNWHPGDYRLSVGSTAIGAGVTVANTDLPSFDNLITIQGVTYCNNSSGSCDQLLSFGYGLGDDSTLTMESYAPTWTARSGAWDLGAVLHGGSEADITPPTVTSATIDSTGLLLTILFDESCTGNAGFTITPSGGAATLTYASGTGPNRVYDISRAIDYDETVTFSYTAGDVEDIATNALATITTVAVVNNSNEGYTAATGLIRNKVPDPVCNLVTNPTINKVAYAPAPSPTPSYACSETAYRSVTQSGTLKDSLADSYLRIFWGQVITAGEADRDICTVTWDISRTAGDTSSKTYVTEIWSLGGSNELDTLLGQSDTLTGFNSASTTRVTFTFSPAVTAAAGNAIILRRYNTTDGDASNYISVHYVSSNADSSYSSKARWRDTGALGTSGIETTVDLSGTFHAYVLVE